MDLKKLATLKDKLVHGKDFYAIMDYFMTEFGEQEGFLQLGKPVRNASLEQVLGATLKELFPKAPAILMENMALVELDGQQFIHGGFWANGCVSTVIYFSDLQVGMVAVAESIRGKTHFLRFSGRLVAPNLSPSRN